MKRVLCTGIFLSLLICGMSAVPFTTMGDMKVPNAYSLSHKMVEISMVNYYAKDVKDDYKYTASGVLNFGLYDRVTLGCVYNSNGIAYGNLKLQAIRETESIPAIAFGVDNLFSPIQEFRDDGNAKELRKIAEYADDYKDASDVDDYIQNSLYFVISKGTTLRGIPMIPYLDATLNMGMGTRRFYGNDDLSKQLSGFFMSLDLSPNKYTTIFAEMDGYNVNAGLDLTWKNVDFRVGAYRLEEIDRQDAKIAANIMYTIDQFSTVKNADKRHDTVYGSTINSRSGKVISSQSPDAGRNPLMEKLDEIRVDREKREKELEEIRKILEEK